MDVRTLPLTSGQELVFELLTVTNGFIEVKNPMVFQTVRNPQTGEPMHGFGEWPALRAQGDDVLQIPVTAVMLMPVKAHEEVERNYIANVTGLELPPATPKILLG